MKIEYDSEADALYIYFCEPGRKVAETVTIKPGVHVDFDAEGKIMGLEILSASKVKNQLNKDSQYCSQEKSYTLLFCSDLKGFPKKHWYPPKTLSPLHGLVLQLYRSNLNLTFM
jgi:uncharacterized protein YuzE